MKDPIGMSLMVLALVALGLIVLARAAFGEAVNMNDLDTYDLERVNEYESILTYYNSAGMNSWGMPPEMAGDGFTVRLQLSITAGDETLTVFPSEGWVAMPETVSVADGDTAQVRIIRYVGF